MKYYIKEKSVFKTIISNNLKENRNIKYEKIIFNYIVSYLIIKKKKYF